MNSSAPADHAPDSSLPSDQPSVCHLNRRSFLQAVAATAGVVILNGCGGSGDTPPPAKSSIAAVPVGEEFKIPGAQNLKAGEALAFTLPKGKNGLVFVDQSGQFKSLSGDCTHAGCVVLWQNSSEIHCPCHGSRFDLAGKVLQGPATKPLPTYSARKQGEDVLIKVTS